MGAGITELKKRKILFQIQGLHKTLHEILLVSVLRKTL